MKQLRDKESGLCMEAVEISLGLIEVMRIFGGCVYSILKDGTNVVSS